MQQELQTLPSDEQRQYLINILCIALHICASQYRGLLRVVEQTGLIRCLLGLTTRVLPNPKTRVTRRFFKPEKPGLGSLQTRVFGFEF